MPQFGGPSTPRGGISTFADDAHPYGLWDAAYVLGALSAADRREYEQHLGTCMTCRQAASELSGMPALLSQLDIADAAALDEQGQLPGVAPAMPAAMLNSVMALATRRQRRMRLKYWTLTAAAATLLTLGGFLALYAAFYPHFAAAPAGPQGAASALTMAQVTPNAMSGTVSLTSNTWGTGIEINCTLAAPPDYPGRGAENALGEGLAMVVVGRDGSTTVLATWMGLVGVSASPRGSTSTPMAQIAAVQVVSTESGHVLLQRNL